MAYYSLLYRLLNADFARADELPKNFKHVRNILVYGNKRGSGSPKNSIRQILRLVYETPFKSYLHVMLDPSIQFERGRSSQIFLQEVYDTLLSPEGWFEEEVFMEASGYVDQSLLAPLRERFSMQENIMEVFAIAVVVYCLVAYKVMTNAI